VPEIGFWACGAAGGSPVCTVLQVLGTQASWIAVTSSLTTAGCYGWLGRDQARRPRVGSKSSHAIGVVNYWLLML